MLMAPTIESAAREAGLIESQEVKRSWAEVTERRRWLTLTARSGKELDSADWLRVRDVPVYWPNYSRSVNVGHRINNRQRQRSLLCALIPGYLFLPMDMADSIPWMLINQTPAITGFLRDGVGDAAFMLNPDIELIRKIEAGENTPKPKDLVYGFKTGDKVRFADDLHGRWPPGRVMRTGKSGRISVETVLLGRSVSIEVLPHQIERI